MKFQHLSLLDICLLFINGKGNISQHPFQNKQLVVTVVKEDIQVANKQEKNAGHHEHQRTAIKITVRCYYTPVKTAKIKQTDNTEYWQDVEE